MNIDLPSRKEMNQDQMNELVSELAEFVGGDNEIIGELFQQVFFDLSATKQEYYIKQIKARIKEERSK